MKFDTPLLRGTLVKRYKRFMADIILEDGVEITAHCANSGSMLSLLETGAEVWVSPADNPKRKLRYTWELVRAQGVLVGINTARPNAIVAEAVAAGRIDELAAYRGIRREVKYGKNSRIDLLLDGAGLPDCYVEVKNVTLKRAPDPHGALEFPDAVTSRGAKHLAELSDMVRQGHRAVMLYLVQRDDGGHFSLATDIDPAYRQAFDFAKKSGVEALCYRCRVCPEEITLGDAVPIVL
ncbi:DNA/RNA nuclease SfsA [Varunaivibrio sulfuroxidans]|uniref:Sugar fermentation stimulation protein homolog n=1 Tax=Varunaivibrio sulfuroxidans TaxID=1773489 RepID=A0A4R3JGQ9_9PROT|nr:DNA/RNA nuclease SfsA [Varunaivibrio sulfuroxidans]TCS65087.1 sugar fermentation stimulation protein A [Varunaivibrio sulfuroxidans]WES29626.1 DNA/RNA nuclease SfsA [Varunaivibrio sulfuroxidans]